MSSEPNDVFCWRWMNLKEGDSTKYSDFQHFYWAVHVSDTIWDGKFPDNFIHEWRLPWPQNDVSMKEYDLNELRSIHFARVNTLRQRNKERFYQVCSRASKDGHRNIVYLYRMYHCEDNLEYKEVPKDAYVTYENAVVDLWKLTDLTDEGEYYTESVKKYFAVDGVQKYAMLDIWDKDWCARNNITNPQRWYHRIVMNYLRWSNEHRNIVTKAVDKLWKLIS